MSKLSDDILERVRELELQINRSAPPRVSREQLEQEVAQAVRDGRDIYIKHGIGWGEQYIKAGTYHTFDMSDAVKVGMLTRTGMVTTGELSRQSAKYNALKGAYEEQVKPLLASYLRSQAQAQHDKQVLLDREVALKQAREAVKAGIEKSDEARSRLEGVYNAIIAS